MKKQKIIGVVIILISVLIFLSKRYEEPKTMSVISEWEKFEVMVRDGLLNEQDAKKILQKIVLKLEKQYNKKFNYNNKWVFPLEGYDYRSMDRNNFLPEIVYGPYGTKGYNFFDGNKHGGHPAYDIFIVDKNQDCIDDRTKLPVNVLSMKDCMILSINTGWEKGSKIRGGNYVWSYDFVDKMFIYYAHLDKIFVSPGQFVKSGEKIGTVGRTGFLANKKSSPTHLHLMVLKYEDGQMIPYNFYNNIIDKKVK